MKQQMFLTDLWLKDLKELDPIGKLFQFFIMGKEEVENSEAAMCLYKALGWDGNLCYYDVINSFWTTFSFAMHAKFPEVYSIAKAGNVKIYKNHFRQYDSFPEKYFHEKSPERERVTTLCQECPDIIELAEFCHCMANFMPCPKGFNSAKGLLKDVRDYFPLMIDKIQDCVEQREDMTYNRQGKIIEVPWRTVETWKHFFITHQRPFCLDMYYEIKDGNKLIGIPFFQGQSLDHPCPQNRDEAAACLGAMVKRIKDRAEMLVGRADARV